MKLHHADKVLNGQTTKEEFIKLFGDTVKQHFDNPDNKVIVLIATDCDDGARFTFKDGRPVRFEYWTPRSVEKANEPTKDSPLLLSEECRAPCRVLKQGWKLNFPS
ncbi:hypothetical protein [Fulvivirga sp.]|uniref:hypothetical protein n=1 Tax=Fulvivirga sp. TaxID=1931237 RepID=UPI0032EF5B4D